jgi:hypothetical protein
MDFNPTNFSVFSQVVLIQKLSYGILIYSMIKMKQNKRLINILGTINMIFITVNLTIRMLMIVFYKVKNCTLFKKFKNKGLIINEIKFIH